MNKTEAFDKLYQLWTDFQNGEFGDDDDHIFEDTLEILEMGAKE